MEKFIYTHKPPTDRQREVLELIIEECAEVQQRATKILRFGLEEAQKGQEYTNAQRLGHEIGDLLEVLTIGIVEGFIPLEHILMGMKSKKEKLKKYLRTEPNDFRR